MNTFHPKRIWFWIAIAAITLVVITLLLPHAGNAAGQQAWVALLPMFALAFIAPFSQELLDVLNIRHAMQTPALSPSFQRPPPAILG
jgi:hypothetical protein